MVQESAELVAFVPVRDVARARAFYEDVLGCVVESADDFGCAMRSLGTRLRLARVEDHEPAPFTVVGWVVPSVAETVGRLRDRGVAFHRFDHMEQDEFDAWLAPSGDRVAWFPDSEGNTLSLTQPG